MFQAGLAEAAGVGLAVVVRAELALESQRLVVSRPDKAEGKLRRIYALTDEGRRKAEAVGARA